MDPYSPCGTLELPRKRADSDNPRDRVDLRLDPSIIARCDRMRVHFAENLSAYIRRAIMERLLHDEDNHLHRNGNGKKRRGGPQ